MYKKPGFLLWLDTKIKTKEDFQLLIVAVFIAFIICTKCYMMLSPGTNTCREANSRQPSRADQALINTGYSFTK
ncbi:hypothetical protein [Mucilaginibacter sp. dw_454]|uniref:hypothetical protein n=1 Tax=Mucilaginibacter sp. dw_454 TaxID=2720079 RepID=UPI001BD582E2|nr:hypothetical protein [Mucilaginibacter sp. dw_454]